MKNAGPYLIRWDSRCLDTLDASPKYYGAVGKLRPKARMSLRLRNSMSQMVSEGERNSDEEDDNSPVAGKTCTTQKRIESLTSIYEKVRVS